MGRVRDFFRSLAGICDTERLDDTLWEIREGRAAVPLGRVPQLGPAGGAVYLAGKGLKKPILLMNAGGGGYLAYTNACTHGGRKLDPASDGRGLRCCSVNHSTFDLDGAKTGGPAKGPLTTHEVEEREGTLLISL